MVERNMQGGGGEKKVLSPLWFLLSGKGPTNLQKSNIGESQIRKTGILHLYLWIFMHVTSAQFTQSFKFMP
jgi:hypothetical protein